MTTFHCLLIFQILSHLNLICAFCMYELTNCSGCFDRFLFCLPEEHWIAIIQVNLKEIIKIQKVGWRMLKQRRERDRCGDIFFILYLLTFSLFNNHRQHSVHFLVFLQFHYLFILFFLHLYLQIYLFFLNQHSTRFVQPKTSTFTVGVYQHNRAVYIWMKYNKTRDYRNEVCTNKAQINSTI